MRRPIPHLLLLLSIFITQSYAQSPPPTVRDAEALTTLQTALAALGGQQAISQIETSLAQVQTRGGLNDPISAAAVWKNMPGEFRYEDAQSGQVLVSGHGSPAAVINGVVQALPAYMGTADLAPHLVAIVIANQVQNVNYALQFAGNGTLNGTNVAIVRSALNTDDTTALVTQQTWYFDTGTGLPVQVDYLLPGRLDPSASSLLSVALSNYQTVQNVMLPFTLTYMLNGQVIEIVSLASVTFNSGVSQTDFDIPAGGTL